MENKDLILIVDDEYSNRLLLEELLSEYNVACAEGAEEMWEVLHSQKPSLILMDVMMPDEDGFSLAKKINADPKYKDIPIIFVTAKVTGKDVETGFELGGYDYIKKPFNQLELESRIKKVLTKSKSEKILTTKVFTAEKILKTMSDGILVIDTNGTVLDINQATTDMLEYEKEEIVGKDANEFSLNKDFKPYAETTSETQNIETVLVAKNGMQIPVIAANSAVTDDSGNINAWVSVIHDISVQKETEQKLIHAKEKAEQADKLKSAFVANMSHEIRTPMNSIIGFSELLDDPELTEDEKIEYIGIIQKNGDKLLNFIDNLLDISIIEAGQISINKSDCYVNQILSELHSSFTIIKKKKEKEDVDLILSPDNSDLDFKIQTDIYRFQQILMNLLGNSIKFTHKGQIEFGYTVNDDTIEFFVSDTGIGIPDDMLEIIFDRFRQVQNNETTNISGTGLGLAISKNLSELLGGTLSVESEYGRGTSFYLKLPLQ